MTATSPIQLLIQAESQQPAAAVDADRPGADQGTLPPLTCEWVPWGPEQDGAPPPTLLATMGSIELEYAALRRGVGRFDAAHRGVIQVTGADGLDLLDRLLTQRLADLQPGGVAESFLTDRTGRVQADIVVVHGEGGIWLDVDAHQCDATIQCIQDMCFGEDVELADRSATTTRIDLFGPAACDVAATMGFDGVDSAVCVHADAVAWRRPDGGVPGVSLAVPAGAASATWAAIDEAARGGGHTCRTVGWYALNMARVEDHEPLANIDFGVGNLPAETGVLHRRVSFEKGCYPGQEVVARMHNLGHPKQVLRALHMPDTSLPVAGAQIFAHDDTDLASPLGAVTSSAPAPLASQRGTALAMLRWKIAEPGGKVQVMTDGAPILAKVLEIES